MRAPVSLLLAGANAPPGAVDGTGKAMLYQFADCHLVVARRELRRGHALVAVRPLPLDVLVYLVQNRDRFVTKDELARVVWGRLEVSDQAIARAVADARRAIGDDGATQRLIQTVHGLGYRFTGVVTQSTDGPSSVAGHAAPTSACAAVEDLRRAADRVSGRLASLPSQCRSALRLMAVMGQRFEHAALLRAAADPGSRIARVVLLDTLAHALRCGLIEETGGSHRYRFAHEVIRTLVMGGGEPDAGPEGT